uniref:NB-ARC domain-containing protein n=1 Tax=Fagus sylvatica TaxID=28930 RepID=A0A2N9EWF0_FAGSY
MYKRWLTNVDQIIGRGKEATKKTTNAAKLFQEAAGKFIFEELMEALRDDNCKRIGLHGLGGVGKTTLVMDVCKKAKDLFSDIVMTTVSQTPDIRKIQVDDSPALNDVVLQVVEECKGLPIAIVTVGKALKRKSLTDWEVALQELKNSRLVEICGVDEDNNAYELSRYAMGLEEYNQDVNSLDEVRKQVHVAINHIRESSLLLKSFNGEGYVKMHDMVRDVALWIASKGENEFKLRVLHSDNLSSLGKLKRLETLSFHKCGMAALPNELGEMESLRMLDLTGCDKLRRIPPNVIQRLSRLEELIIGWQSFKNWDVEGTSAEISNANVSELNSLPRLVMLSMWLDLKHLPQGFDFPRTCKDITYAMSSTIVFSSN